MARRHISHNQRIELLNGYAESGVSIKEYAVSNGIGYSTFQRWLQDQKTTFNAASGSGEDSLKTAPFQISDQRLNASPLLQCHDQPDAPMHFVDITSHVIRTLPKVEEEANEKTHLRGTNDYMSTPSSTHTADVSNQTTPLAQDSPLDIFLPNGIRMTFHQASLDASITLIKSLV